MHPRWLCLVVVVLAAGGVTCGKASIFVFPRGMDGGEPEVSTGPESESGDAGRDAPDAGPVFLRDWVVSPTGNDSAAGTAVAPFRTISRAVAVAGPGERILVRAGTYAERVAIGVNAKAGAAFARITLQGEGKPRIIPGNTSSVMISIERPYWTVDGFEVDVQGARKYAVAFIGDAVGSVLSGSHLHGGTLGAGVTTYGGAHGASIEGNEIHGFWLQDVDSHGIAIQPSSRDITIRNNRIYGNSGDSIQCAGPEGLYDAPPPDHVLIEGNDLYGNVEQSIDIKSCYNVTVRRNRMHGARYDPVRGGNATMVVHLSPRNVIIEENDFYDAGLAVGVGGVHTGPVPYQVIIRKNRIHDMITQGGLMTGGGLVIANSESAVVENNTFTRLAGPALLLGTGDGGATSNLTVKNNLIEAATLVVLGTQAPGLVMDSNLFQPGGVFRQLGTVLDFVHWQLLGYDGRSQQTLPGLNPDTFVPGPAAIDKGEDVGLPYCGAAPDVGAVETGC